MTTISIPRLLSTIANPVLHHTRSDQLTRSVSNSVTRLLYSSSTQQHHENPSKEQEQPPQASLHDKSEQSREEEEEEEEDDNDVNKETGEVGGPKGPEPTRYGDWERNGRCSDF